MNGFGFDLNALLLLENGLVVCVFSTPVVENVLSEAWGVTCPPNGVVALLLWCTLLVFWPHRHAFVVVVDRVLLMLYVDHRSYCVLGVAFFCS